MILTYKQKGLEDGREMPIQVAEMEGARLVSMREEADPQDAKVQYRSPAAVKRGPPHPV